MQEEEIQCLQSPDRAPVELMTLLIFLRISTIGTGVLKGVRSGTVSICKGTNIICSFPSPPTMLLPL